MLEVVWTRRAEDHVQRIFSKLDEYSPRIAESWLDEIGKRADLLARFPEMATVWRAPYRCSKLRRGLGLFYVIEGRRLIVSGIFPLRMGPAVVGKAGSPRKDWIKMAGRLKKTKFATAADRLGREFRAEQNRRK